MLFRSVGQGRLARGAAGGREGWRLSLSRLRGARGTARSAHDLTRDSRLSARRRGGSDARMILRIPVSELVALARSVLGRVGLEDDKALAVAEVLVEADLLGHATHGLALLAPYLGEIERGGMARSGEPRVIADFPAVVTWDGGRLPGPWLVRRALELAMERAERNGLCAVTIRRSHHIACLAAFLRPVAERGLVAILTCSDPAVATVAPFGGRKGLFTPNPIAAAWPTDGDPIILDFSASITTNALTKRLQGDGRRFPGTWALDAAGVPTDDPAALFTEPPGTLLPTGGVDHGHKGFALALLVEALTSADRKSTRLNSSH